MALTLAKIDTQIDAILDQIEAIQAKKTAAVSVAGPDVQLSGSGGSFGVSRVAYLKALVEEETALIDKLKTLIELKQAFPYVVSTKHVI